MRTRFLHAGFLSIVSLIAGIAHAGSIAVTPVFPTTADPIHIVVSDGFTGGICWKVQSRTCTLAAPDSVIVTADIQFCNGSTLGCFCTAQPVAFQVTCDFPPLPVGTYKAVYRERYLNPIDERNQAPYSTTFTVSAPTPALRRTWGRVKAYYR